MIRLIEALNYRCLRYVRRPLNDFQVLVGPNASGKTTFFDVVGFISDLLTKGLDEAITTRTRNIQDLFYLGHGDRFELAVELEVPMERSERLLKDNGGAKYKVARYELSVGIESKSQENHIFNEQLILLSETKYRQPERTLFPSVLNVPETIMHPRSVARSGKKLVVRKNYTGNDNFYAEAKKIGKSWAPSYRLGPRRSALANLPDVVEDFPIATWLRDTLRESLQNLMLNSLSLRQTSRPGQGLSFKPDGSNLPWVVNSLRVNDLARFRQWIEHIRTALPDIEDVSTVELPDTRERFLQVVYRDGFKVPSWMVSDGTLRMFALTLPAYLTSFKGVYLIEEPENGIHPMAMETVFQALKNVHTAQILLATHSPVILSCAEPSEILCFKKDDEGATDVVSGDEHPQLRKWQGKASLRDLYASGVLG